MIRKIRKLAGVSCCFILVFILTLLFFPIVSSEIGIGPLRFSYGDLPSGDKFAISFGAVLLFGTSIITSFSAAQLYTRWLQRQTATKASAISMLTVILLTAVLAFLGFSIESSA